MCVVKKQRTINAGVAELADALDLGSSVSDMQVRPLSPAPKNRLPYEACFFIHCEGNGILSHEVCI